MLTAISSEGPELNSHVAEKFSRAPYVVLYHTKTGVHEVLCNPYTNQFGGAGIQTAQLIIETNVNAVLACDIGLNAFRLLRSAYVKVYPCLKLKVSEVIREFELGRLIEVKREPKEHSKRIKNKLY